MADQEHLDILKQGVEAWNQWRKEHPELRPDFSEARLKGAELSGFNLSFANLSGANLKEAHFFNANLYNAVLSTADLSGANLWGANLSSADLGRANLDGSILININFTCATLTGCHIYGISAWGVELQGAIQNNLVITPWEEPAITVDNLEVAQFIYLLLNNAKIRDVINTITTKAVLILGRFTDERKAVLDALREELRKPPYNYIPVLFDFEKPSSRDFTETVSTLAHLARFIIADLTDPSSIPQELQAIIPNLTVPVQPILLAGKREYSMFEDYHLKFHWVLPIYHYVDQDQLLAKLKEKVIDPAEEKAQELERRFSR